MRRKDREVTDKDKIRGIISNCHCCRLGLNDHGRVYIVPLSFGFQEKEGSYTFYFHGAKAGRKMDLIKENGYAGFEMDTNYALNEADRACEYSARFQSVIGSGRVSVIEDAEEKQKALRAIMYHNTGKDEWKFSDKMVNAACVFQLKPEELSCKEHL